MHPDDIKKFEAVNVKQKLPELDKLFSTLFDRRHYMVYTGYESCEVLKEDQALLVYRFSFFKTRLELMHKFLNTLNELEESINKSQNSFFQENFPILRELYLKKLLVFSAGNCEIEYFQKYIDQLQDLSALISTLPDNHEQNNQHISEALNKIANTYFSASYFQFLLNSTEAPLYYKLLLTFALTLPFLIGPLAPLCLDTMISIWNPPPEIILCKIYQGALRPRPNEDREVELLRIPLSK